MKIRQPVFLLALALIIIYAAFYATTSNAENIGLIRTIYSANFRAVNPLIFSIFNLLGVWPMIYAVLVLEEGEAQSFPVWPFILLSFFMGGFVYLVYYSLRSPEYTERPKTRTQKQIEKQRNMILLLLVGVSLVFYGLIYGDWTGYIDSFQTNGLVHIMSIDFVLISLMFPVLIKNDMIRRDQYSPIMLGVYSVLGVVGALIYLNRRIETT